MKVPSPRKTTSGCTHHASRRIVSPKDRRLRTSKAMLEHPLFVVAVLKPQQRGGGQRVQEQAEAVETSQSDSAQPRQAFTVGTSPSRGHPRLLPAPTGWGIAPGRRDDR